MTKKTKPAAVARHRPGRMNKTEALYEKTLLARKMAGEIHDYKFEPVKLRLADSTYYTPDFLVVMADGEIWLHEVKGFWRDDARVKFKTAAEAFPWFGFCAITSGGKKGWHYEILR